MVSKVVGEKVLLSIIIPIFNVQDYIIDCLQSLSGDFSCTFEVILVDDGSTDKSGIIAQEFAGRYPNYRYIHKTNGGLSDARNTGLLEAVGKFAIFLDSDDELYFSELHSMIELADHYDTDILFGKYIKIPSQIKQKSYKVVQPINGVEFLTKSIQISAYEQPVWRAIYKRDFLLQNNLLFMKGRLHEDFLWTPRTLILALKVMEVDTIFYKYRIRENSITQQKDKTLNGLHIIQSCHELESIFMNISDDSSRNIISSILPRAYFNAIYMARSYVLNNKALIKKGFPLKYSRTVKHIALSLLLLLNTSLFCRIFGMFKKE